MEALGTKQRQSDRGLIMGNRIIHTSLAAGFVAVGLLLITLPVSKAGDKVDPKAELKRFENRWRVWRIENKDGIVADAGDGMLIEGDAIQFLWGGNNLGARAKFTIDPAKDPKEIDVKFTSGSGIGQKQLGIYRLGKDTLEISWGGVGDGKRPTKFTGKLTPGAGQTFFIYRGEQFKEDPAVVKELKRLAGKWSEAKGNGCLIEGHNVQFYWGGNNIGARVTFEIDPTKDPKEIEVVYNSSWERYRKRIGIYRLVGDRLEISLSDLGVDQRPTRFAGGDAPGAGKWFAVYERAKAK
jgi:uncharacterized protein (TIGR03067 family)